MIYHTKDQGKMVTQELDPNYIKIKPRIEDDIEHKGNARSEAARQIWRDEGDTTHSINELLYVMNSRGDFSDNKRVTFVLPLQEYCSVR